MADPISIISGIVGITAAAIKLSTELYNLCDNITSSQNQIEDLAGDLTDFSLVVDELRRIFERRDQIGSRQLIESVKGVLDKCMDQFIEIRLMIGKAESESPSKTRLRIRVAWIFRQQKVQRIMSRLNANKSTLLLMLQTLQIASDKYV